MKVKRINRLSEEESGAIGIGTLIVFIGLILVAAIASAVIIGVMGDLQERAKRTGRETQQNVHPPIKVREAEAFTAGGDTIDELRITATAVEGTRGYNLENLIIHIVGEDGVTGDGFNQRFAHESLNPGNLDSIDGTFQIERFTNEDPEDPNYLYTDELVGLNITEDLYPIGPDSDITFRFLAAEGATASILETVTPVSYPDTGWFDLTY
ncbi:MAG: hypothetical protein V5A88_04500 [Candidatus Thermoplasmatota archaeon]